MEKEDNVHTKQPNLRRILVAIDGSELGDYALNVAIDVADHYMSRIDVLHVIPLPKIGVSMPIVDPLVGSPAITVQTDEAVSRRTESTSRQKLGSEHSDLVQSRLAVVTERNLSGEAFLKASDNVSEEIIKTSIERNYDMVVLGSRGLGGFKSFLLGSVSKKVAKEAKCSTLIVSKRVGSKPKFLIGYDGSVTSEKALALAIDLSKKLGARLDVLGVVSLPVASEGSLLTDIERWDRAMKEVVERAVQRASKEGIESAGAAINASDEASAIAEAARKVSYDLVLIGGSSNKSGLRAMLLGSVATGIVNSARTNLLVVR
jgi:nucleotide-binding universal stress UspA family protein